jgi:TRAP-type mannitol/chloroaromatic compound transport system permease small subunit
MTARYLATATGLGFAWYVVLQIPSTTRSFMAGIGQITAALLLCLVSAVVAAALRRFIANSDNDRWLTVAGPYSGAVLFGLSAAITIWIRNGFRALNYFDLFVLLPFRSLLVAVWCALLVLPMGYVAQRAMRWASGEDDHRQVD